MKSNTAPSSAQSGQLSNTPSPANSVESILVDYKFADFVAESEQIPAMRQNLRTWFLHNLNGWEERAGTPIDKQAHHFELLDDLLAGLMIASAKQSDEA